MIKKFTDFVTGLGVFNHAFLSLFFVPIIGFLFTVLNPFYAGAFTVCFGYYFREHAHSNKYNPLKWAKHDYIQSVILVMVSVIVATILTAFVGDM